jgi:uridylate kinase
MTGENTGDNPRRVLLKLSGEAFGGGKVGIDTTVVRRIAEEIVPAVKQGVQVAIVVGGGNFFRGAELQQAGIDRSRGDYMGMLGTVMNCLALQDFLEQEGQATRVQTAITMGQVAEPYIPLKAIRHLEKGRVVIFGAGAGMPYFSTDTVSIQRSLEIHCDEVLMGKNGVDGVYTADPRKDENAKRFATLSYNRALVDNLAVMDAAALSMARDNKQRIRVFGLEGAGNVTQALLGEEIGTMVSPSDDIQSRISIKPTILKEQTMATIVDQAKAQMAKSVESTKENFSGIRTGRANPALLNGITVDYYGAPTPLKAVATIGVPEPRTLAVTPFDASQANAVEKALRDSDLGASPRRDGNVIRLTMPELTEERRKEYVKIVKGKAEDGKVAVRNIRRKAKESLDKAIKDGDMGEDEGDRLLKELDKVTKQTTDELDALLETKQKEIMEV